jgi:hypothetical protein
MKEDINVHKAKNIFESRMSADLRMTSASHVKNIYSRVSSERNL